MASSADVHPRRAAARPPTRPVGAAVAVARHAFLTREPFDVAAVRAPILDSWTRSRERSVPIEHLEVPYTSELDDDTALSRAADQVLGELSDALSGEAVSLVVCDAAGTVLRRQTGDGRLERHLDRVSLAPGFSYAERHVGTNGIGIALESATPARVYGHEHFAEHLEHLACAAAPVRHPLTGEVAGVVNLTCREPDAGALLLATVTTIARQIREALLDEAGRRERALLDEFLAACRRGPRPVVALGGDVVILNRQARQLLGPAEQRVLLAQAMDALASGRQEVVVDLPDGTLARVVCAPTSGAGRDGDAVLQVQLGAPAAAPAPRASAADAATGASPVMSQCRRAVHRHLAGRSWLVIEGEAGTGKATLVRAAHAHLPAPGPLRVLDAADASPQWLAQVAGAVAGPDAAVLLRRVDRLQEPDLAALVDLVSPLRDGADAGRPWLVATVGPLPPRPSPGLAALLACFSAPVVVPPLRHRGEDLPALVSDLLARLGGGRPLTCTAAAMRLLAAHCWPGNVAELQRVLATAAAGRRGAAVEVSDLPPELLAAARRALTPLEALERDAILAALARARGSKGQAAAFLGMSRATIYRKLRQYGLSEQAGGGRRRHEEDC